MRAIWWLLAVSCLLLAGCVGQVRDLDDDTADDDTADDDTADDDVGDDDGADDDTSDDDTSDDDTSDDDTSDDDTSDDDTSDDDTSDDDTSDDDTSDDDTSDDDTGDDDTSDDDTSDDDTSDDDTSDDDTGDDDTGDDDTGDDDTGPGCTLPNYPSITFDSPSGQFAGQYTFAYGTFCGTTVNLWRITADEDFIGMSSMTLTSTIPPTVGAHLETEFGLFWQVSPTYAGEVTSGGPDCYADIVQDTPSVGGCFQCLGVPVQGVLNTYYVDIVDGAFLCP